MCTRNSIIYPWPQNFVTLADCVAFICSLALYGCWAAFKCRVIQEGQLPKTRFPVDMMEIFCYYFYRGWNSCMEMQSISHMKKTEEVFCLFDDQLPTN